MALWWPALIPIFGAMAPYVPWLIGAGALLSGFQIGQGIFGVNVWTGQPLSMEQRGWYVGSGIVGAGASFYAGAKYEAITRLATSNATTPNVQPISNPNRMLPSQAGPTGYISPSEVVGQTPTGIASNAQRLGLQAMGPSPTSGQGSFIDPQTGIQRILVHPNAIPPHAHVNNVSGLRIDINGNVVPQTSPNAHLPIKIP